jgi:hypothetical protein
MADVLKSVVAPARHVYIRAVNEFAPIESLKPLEERGVVVLPSLGAVRAEHARSIAETLRTWNAEAHALLLFSDDDQAKQAFDGMSRSEAKWWRLTLGSFEKGYLEQVPESDPVVFFAESHTSFEVFGTPDTVWSVLDLVRKRLAAYVHQAQAS